MDNGGERGKGFSGTTIKDTWTKPRQVEAREGGGDGWGGEAVVGSKSRQVCLTNNKIIFKT